MSFKEVLELSIKLLRENNHTDEADVIESNLFQREQKLTMGDEVTVLRKNGGNSIEMLPGKIVGYYGLVLVDAYSVQFKDSCFAVIAPAGNILKYDRNTI